MSDTTITSESVLESEERETVTPAKKKGVFRLLALLLLAACGALFFLKVNVFYGFSYDDTEFTVLETLKNLFDKKITTEKMFKFFPVFVNGSGLIFKLASLSIYVLVGAAGFAAILALLALFTGSSRLLNFSAFVLLFGALAYACSVYFVGNIEMEKKIYDTWTLALAGVALFVALLSKCAKNGKIAWLWFFQMLLVVGAMVVALASLTKEYREDVGLTKLAKIAYYAVAALALLSMLVFAGKKANPFVAFLALVAAGGIVALLYVKDKDVLGDKTYAIIAASAAAVLFLSTLFKSRKKAVANAQEEAEEAEEAEVVEATPVLPAAPVLPVAPAMPAPVAPAVLTAPVAPVAPVVAEEAQEAKEVKEEYKKETFVEAYAYDGGPVAGVELAEEVFPTLSALDARKDPEGAACNTVASLLGNGFDPFLIMLNEQEKEEFIDLYILKCKGPMPEIPGYVVGGNNKEFFNCVFIYLGQYREKIPARLLEKMYKFSMKI